MDPEDSYWRRPEGDPVVVPEPAPPRASPAAASAPAPTRPTPARVIPPQLRERRKPPPPAPPPALAPGYAGPPLMAVPASDWWQSLDQGMEPPPPRELPAQDTARINAEERQARAVTVGLGIVATLVMFAVLCVLCARSIFG